MTPLHLIKVVLFLTMLFQTSIPELSCAKHQIKDKYIAFQEKHFKQIKSFNQVLFEYIFFNEKNAPVLSGASGLCGLLSIYGGLRLMEALELETDSEKPSSYIKKITSIDHFYQWVNDNKTILADVKDKRTSKTLGYLTPSAIREIAHRITTKENHRPTFKKKVSEYKQNRVTCFTFNDMVADKLLDAQYRMVKEFRASKNPKPLLVIFGMERYFYLDWIEHCIAVVITKDTTWIIDPCNYDFTIDDYYIQQLDSFVRTGKTFPPESMSRYLLSSLPKWFIKKSLKTLVPRSFLSKKESLYVTEPINEEKLEDPFENDDAMKELMALDLEKYLELYVHINSSDDIESDEPKKSESEEVVDSTPVIKTASLDS